MATISDSQIYINERQSDSDIRELEKAKNKLLESRDSLRAKQKSLNSVWEGNGKEAFNEKTNTLVRDINNTIESINATQKGLQNAIISYREAEKRIKAAIEASTNK